MKKVLLSAFSCSPFKGSEPSYGWNWSLGLVQKGYEVHTFTRTTNRADIEQAPQPNNLYFHYISLSFGLEKLYSSSQAGMYLYYILWQWKAYMLGCKLEKINNFHRIHHVSWGSLQQGSFLYKLKAPFIFGPAGGGQIAPDSFKMYFKEHWRAELKRERVSNWLSKYNPACKKMVQNAEAVLVSNKDTFSLAKQLGAKNLSTVLDVALPESFFPLNFPVKKPSAKLKLLWIGRFMPRKGILLVLEVMDKLKVYPEIELTVVGDGEMKDEFLETINRLDLKNQVNWVGKVPFEQVKGYYSTHDVFFFTSLRESGGVQLIEAMAYGLPVVTLNIHGSAMIVGNQQGIKIEVTNPTQVIEDLVTAIISLNQDREKLNLLSKGAFRYAREYTWSKVINKVVNEFY